MTSRKIRYSGGGRLLLLSSLVLLIHSASSAEPSCTKLRSPLGGDSFEIRDGSVIGNLVEEYDPLGTQVHPRWNGTVESGCELKACDGLYGTGNCTVYSAVNRIFSGAWKSTECNCNRKCKCSDIHLRRSVCAQAYLQPGAGCGSCNAPYTELVPGDHPDFSQEWSDKVTSFLVRQGCTMKVYQEEDYEGASESLEGPSNRVWKDMMVGSYECTCNDDTYSPRVIPPQTSNIPSLDISARLDDLVSNYSQHNFSHPGLLAAITSSLGRKSPKNAYILLLGSSGGGKSSLINILLDRENLTMAGAGESTTSQILEFRFPLPLPKLGIANSELRIIDTPGLGDTRGVDNDALFLATLDDYLSEHEELKTRIPNVVLVLHKFPDNRFAGEGAQFVKMIRGLDTLRTKITDESFSNVMFAFSHLSSESSKQLQQNPQPRLMRFAEVIQKFSLFPKPIHTAVLENLGRDNELPMRNGNFQLPNGELFPQNLIQRFNSITTHAKDPIGNALFSAAFLEKRLGELVRPTKIVHDLVSSATHSKVGKYLNILTAASYGVGTTEVSKLLAEAYKTMPNATKSSHPNCLEKLQRFFYIRNVISSSDLPQTGLAILEMLSGLEEQNAANSYLLDKGLSLKPPLFPGRTYVGYSYNLLKDEYLTVTPFNMDGARESSIGFMLADALKSDNSLKGSPPLNELRQFETKAAYMEHRFSTEAKQLKAIGRVLPAYLVKDTSCTSSNSCTFTVKRSYRQFHIELQTESGKNKAKLSSQFLQRINLLQPFNQSDHDNVERWSKFFRDYGTQVGLKAFGGGEIHFKFTLPLSEVDERFRQITKAMDFLDNPIDSIQKFGKDPREVIANASRGLQTLTYLGGNPATHLSDLSKISLDKAVELHQKWKSSLDLYPVVFPFPVRKMKWGSIVEHFVSEEAGAKFAEPYERLLNSTLTYIPPPPPPPPPPPTPDPKILEELARQQKAAEERRKQLEEELRKKKEAAEKQRLAEIEAERLRKIEQLRKARKHREELWWIREEARREREKMQAAYRG